MCCGRRWLTSCNSVIAIIFRRRTLRVYQHLLMANDHFISAISHQAVGSAARSNAAFLRLRRPVAWSRGGTRLPHSCLTCCRPAAGRRTLTRQPPHRFYVGPSAASCPKSCSSARPSTARFRVRPARPPVPRGPRRVFPPMQLGGEDALPPDAPSADARPARFLPSVRYGTVSVNARNKFTSRSRSRRLESHSNEVRPVRTRSSLMQPSSRTAAWAESNLCFWRSGATFPPAAMHPNTVSANWVSVSGVP